MRLPRDLTGAVLIKRLALLGYIQTRQAGSHVRLTTTIPSVHHVAVPLHDPLRVGTLAAIIATVVAHHNLSREQLITRLYE